MSASGYGEIVGGSTFSQILIYNTNEKSSLMVKSKQLVDLGEISEGPLQAEFTLSRLMGKTVNHTGNVELTGSLGMLQVNNVAHDVLVQTQQTTVRGTNIKVNNVDGAHFDITGPVKVFQANSFADGSLIADDIGQVKIKTGSFGADVTATDGNILGLTVPNDITGAISASGTIKRVMSKSGSFTGVARAGTDIGTVQAMSLNTAIVSAAGNIGRISAKQDILDSYLLAGYDIGKDAQPGTADEGEGLNPQGGIIGSIQVGRNGRFVGSYALAGVKPYKDDLSQILPPVQQGQLPILSFGVIKRANLGQVYMGDENVGVYGLFAATEIGRITFTEVPGLNLADFQVKPPWS